MRFTDKIRLEVRSFPVQRVVKEKTNQRRGERLLGLVQSNVSPNFPPSREMNNTNLKKGNQSAF